jgi:hypothetical protein
MCDSRICIYYNWINQSIENKSQSCPYGDLTSFANRISVILTNNKTDFISGEESKMAIIIKNVNDSSSCSNLLLTYKADGAFSSGIAEYDNHSKICKLKYTKSSIEERFSSIKGDLSAFPENRAEKVRFIAKGILTEDQCDTLANCVNGISDLNSDGKCTIVTGSESNEAEQDNIISTTPNPENNFAPESSDGVFRTEFNGLKDIFSIQEVVEGKFGYYSNHTTHPYKNNIVSVNNKEIAPLKELSSISDKLIYEGKFKQISRRTKKPKYLTGALGGASAGAAATYFGIATLGVGIITSAVAYLVVSIFGKRVKLNEQFNFWSVYKILPPNKYINNIYGYDFRTKKELDNKDIKLTYITFGEDPIDKNPPIDSSSDGRSPSQKAKDMSYDRNLDGVETSFTGTLKPGDFTTYINNWFKNKQQIFMISGWSKNSVPQSNIEKNVVVSYPKCKWYKINCDKKNQEYYEFKNTNLGKVMTNYYIGAVNTLNIFLPFLGDFELKAYDKYGELLSSATVYESEFFNSVGDKAAYAQIMFGRNMSLAPQIQDGDKDNACRTDLMVEWGGGVSGIYFENDNTGLNKGCSKSNDAWVQDKSAVKITIKPLNQDKGYDIILEKPLVFPNRVFLVSLNEDETRKYRCFEEFGECDNDGFITDKNGGE